MRCARCSKHTSNGSSGISGASPAFGRPVIVRASVTTQTVSERIDAGESVDDLALDYDLTPNEIEEAVLYERAA